MIDFLSLWNTYYIYIIISVVVIFWLGSKVVRYFKNSMFKDSAEERFPGTGIDSDIQKLANVSPEQKTLEYYQEEVKVIDDNMKSKYLDYKRTENEISIANQRLIHLKIQISKLYNEKQSYIQIISKLKGVCK